MLAIKLRKTVRSRRGQTMVLGSLGVLLVSIMMLLTLNVGQAVHEKIRIQQLADASAFSMATQEARTYNYVAYTNRANIGALVSASSLHSFQSMASSIPEMFNAAYITFLMHAGIEFAICLTCCWPYCFAMCKHCYHGIKDLDAAFNYRDSRDDYRDAVNDVDDWFKKTILALDAHMFYIAGDQKFVVGTVYAQLLQDDITKELRDKIAPQASNNEQMLSFVKNAGTLFGPPDIQGGSRAFGDVFSMDEEQLKYVPTMIANGSRWSETSFGFSLNNWFVSSRNLLEAYAFTHPKALMQLLFKDGKPAKGFSFPISHEGQGRIIKDPGDPKSKIKSSNMGPDGNTGAAYDSGWIMSMGFICIFSMIPMFYTYSAHVASGPDDGTHENSSSCSGADDHTFHCLNTTLGPAGCFAVFKPDDDPKHNFGQPAAFAVIKQDLSMMKGGGKGTWEVDLDTDGRGSINVDLNTGEDIEVQIANNASNLGNGLNQGVAMSKALVYYHYPRYRGDGWKAHPNLFNPYWRAKLHPVREVGIDNLNLTALEAPVVLGLGGADDFIEALPGAPLP